MGLVAAGIEHVSDVKVPQSCVLQFIGSTLQIEQRNTLMNKFIEEVVENMRNAGIYTILVKGQGIAQCYERPLWRPSGDVDFLLSKDNYEKAKNYLLPMSSGQKPEERYSKHLGINIDPWYVEIHGSLRSGLSERVDKEIDAVQREVFYGGMVRSWMNGKTQVFLPAANEDVFFVFTHFIKHFYKEGMTLRQVCDWARLLWTYRDKVDTRLLAARLKRAGLMGEWRAFSILAADILGMPEEAMPLYNGKKIWTKKGEKILKFIVGGYSGNKYKDTFKLLKMFPRNTIRFLPGILWHINSLKIIERIKNI